MIYSLVGTSLATQESVPAAFAVLSAVPGDPWQACLLAASLGGDCDTIAAMAGAIGGAVHGLAAFPPHAVEVIDAQGLALADLADSLLAAAPMTIQNGGVLRPPGPRRLVFAGEAIVDVVMRVPALPQRGGDALATSAEITAGGGFNVMAAAARQGLPVLYAGGHGTGPWGDLVRAALAAEGIDRLRPPDPDRDTGFDVALVEPDAERTFVTHLGAEALSRAWGLGRGAGRAGRRGLRVRLRPGRAGLRRRPRRLGRRPAVRCRCCSWTRARWWRRSRPRCSIPSWPAATG